VALLRTTICCSALALTIASSVTNAAPPPSPVTLFPLQPLWTLPLNSSLAAPAAFKGFRAYLPLEDNRLAAYDLSSGSLQWIVDATPKTRPAVGDDLVFLSQADVLAARRERDGSEAWRIPLAEPLAVPLVWDNGWLVAATTSGAILAFRALDGRLIWRQEIGSPPSAPPALAADRVYVPASDGRVIALRVDTGVPLWERRLGGPPTDMLALDDRVFVGSQDNYFYSLRPGDGVVSWRWRTGGDIVGTPAVDDRHVYFVSLDNVLRALDRRTGAQRWKRALPMRPTTGPLIVNETVLVAGVMGPIRGFLATDGAPAGTVTIAGELAGPAYAAAEPAFPLLIAVTRDIAIGATVLAFTRATEPSVLPLAPLPNPEMPLAPTSS
jgi:outer membrane protein assembly factor BamB